MRRILVSVAIAALLLVTLPAARPANFCDKRPDHPLCQTPSPTASPTLTPTSAPTAVPTAVPTTAPTPPSTSCGSLQTLVNNAPSGSTLTAPACTYREQVTIGKPLTLVTDGGVVSGDNSRTYGFVVSANDVTLDGWEVTGTTNAAQNGAVQVRNVSRFTFRSGYIHHTKGACISVGGGTNHRITDSEFAYCDQEGFHGNHFDGMLFARNHVHHNNPADTYSWGWEAGGGKFAHVRNVTFADNLSHDNDGPGLWVDWNVYGATFTGNRVYDNAGPGIFVECADGGLIADNVAYRNGLTSQTAWGWGAGILVACGKNFEVRNNVVAWNEDGISVISQNRSTEWNQVTGNWVHHNDVILANRNHGNDQIMLGWLQDFSGVMFNAGSNNRGNDNRYWMNSAEPDWSRFGWSGPHSTLSAFNATPGEERGTYLTLAQRDAVLAAAGVPIQ